MRFRLIFAHILGPVMSINLAKMKWFIHPPAKYQPPNHIQIIRIAAKFNINQKNVLPFHRVTFNAIYLRNQS